MVRLYTLREAQDLLPLVVPVLGDIRTAFLRLRGLQAAIDVDARAVTGDGHLLVDPFEATEGEDQRARYEQSLRDGARRLHTWGIELKDPERGLIDFYHDREGQTVFLCYHLGEPSIRYWHTLEGGFAARQLVDE